MSDVRGIMLAKDSYVDCGILEKAREGDRDSIMALCQYLTDCQKSGVFPDRGATNMLFGFLGKVAEGQDPSAAFGWKQATKGRRSQNTAFRDWEVKTVVQERMKHNESWRAACLAVSSESNGEFLLGQKTIENICDGLTVDTKIPIPQDVFPLGSSYGTHRRNPR